MIVDLEFLRHFNAWFNADLINVLDREQLMEDATDIANEVAGWPQAPKILQQLDFVIDNGRPEEVRQFSRATNVDWYFDETTTDLFFDILRIIRDGLRQAAEKRAT
jgi:hypothetical protein